ncbi:MAG: hypothetical protein QOK16_4748 [Solirubrobacteraceae bacterium]|nr:hypothetical protein [Solirubrobacteraceae bacterium]
MLAGARACPRNLLPGNPAQTFDADGFLNDNGTGVQQFSFVKRPLDDLRL